MADKTYPSIELSEDGWVVVLSKGAKLPGVFTNLKQAQTAVRTIEIQTAVAKEKRAASKKGK